LTRKRRRWRISRVVRAHLGYLAGLLILATGFGLALNIGWGLVAAGIGLVAKFVWLYDVDEPEPDDTEGVRLR
jgi:hypothetical protein